MGKQNSNNKVLMMFLLAIHVIFFSLVCCKSSAARPLLMNELNSRNLAGTDRGFNDVNTEEKLGGIYGSLVLNALPKGRTPASGPSRRTNDINI